MSIHPRLGDEISFVVNNAISFVNNARCTRWTATHRLRSLWSLLTKWLLRLGGLTTGVFAKFSVVTLLWRSIDASRSPCSRWPLELLLLLLPFFKPRVTGNSPSFIQLSTFFECPCRDPEGDRASLLDVWADGENPETVGRPHFSTALSDIVVPLCTRRLKEQETPASAIFGVGIGNSAEFTNFGIS